MPLPTVMQLEWRATPLTCTALRSLVVRLLAPPREVDDRGLPVLLLLAMVQAGVGDEVVPCDVVAGLALEQLQAASQAQSYRACRDVTSKGAHVTGICQAFCKLVAAGVVKWLAEQVLSHTAHCAQIPFSPAHEAA